MTNLLLPGLVGCQEPRLCNAPPSVGSAGQDAIDLGEAVGVYLDPWQQLSVRVTLALAANGDWAAFEVALLVARQNGKGEILLVLELYWLFLLGEPLILHTAHEFKTAAEAFLRLKAVIDGSPMLMRRVKTIRTSHGDEGVELKNGCRLRFIARSRSSGRGFTGRKIIMDEAQELPRSAMGALLPTLSAVPNPQIVYAGTVPEEVNNSEQFESLRDRGRAGGDAALAWIEWSPHDEPDLDDRIAWAQSNPALGYRIAEGTVAIQRLALDDASFARERLSIWTENKGTAGWKLIHKAEWAGGATPRPPEDEPLPAEVTFSIEASADRSSAAILAATGEPGAVTVETVRKESGLAWLVDAVVALNTRRKPKAWMIDPRSPVATEARELKALGIELTELKTEDVARAAGSFLDALTTGEVLHYDQTTLNASAMCVVSRKYGEVLLFDRWNDDPIEIIGCSLARWGHLEIAAVKPKPRVFNLADYVEE